MDKVSERIPANKKMQARVKDLMGRVQALENICKESNADTRLLQSNIQDLSNDVKELKGQLEEKPELDDPGPGYEAYNGPTSNSSLAYMVAQLMHLKKETDDRSSASYRKKLRSNWDILNASQRDYSKLSSFEEVAAKKARCDSLKQDQAKESIEDQASMPEKPSSSGVQTSNSLINELEVPATSKSKKSSKTDSKGSFSSKNQWAENGNKVSKDLSVDEGIPAARKSKKKSELETSSHSPEESQSEEVEQKTSEESQSEEVKQKTSKESEPEEIKQKSSKESQPEEVKQKTPKKCRICFKSFPSKKALRLHNKDQHLAIKCLKCDTLIASSSRQNTGNPGYCLQCQLEENSTASVETEEISCEELEECFDCPLCEEKTYKSEERLGKHIEKKHDRK